MRIRCRLKWAEDCEKKAEAVAKALDVSNRTVPSNMKIRTWKEKATVKTEIEMLGKMESFLATLDDLLACGTMAERILS